MKKNLLLTGALSFCIGISAFAGKTPTNEREGYPAYRASHPTKSTQVSEIYKSKKKENSSSLLIIVETSVRSSIQSSLDIYLSDLQNEGYSPILISFSGSSEADLKSEISSRYTNDQIEGAFLIGDLPIAWFESNNYYEGYYDFANDSYFIDLDGTWEDKDNNGKFEVHEGKMDPEIYVGRLRADNLSYAGKSESQLINDYFTRNHSFRTGQTSANEKGLVFIDDEWRVDALNHKSCMDYLLADVEMVNERNETSLSNYEKKLKENFTFAHINVHSSPNSHWWDNGNGSYSEAFGSSDIIDIKPNVLFYNLIACQNADFATSNNMGSLYLLGNDHGLGVIGTSRSGSMQHYTSFYKSLGENFSLGQSYQNWWRDNVDVGDNRDFERGWFYGVGILGDPTLKVKQSYVHASTTWENDSDDDAIFDAGEETDVYFELDASFTDNKIQGTLSTDHTGITILQEDSEFSKQGNGKFKNSSPFRVSAASTLKDQEKINLYITLEDGKRIKTVALISAPLLQFKNYELLEDLSGSYKLRFTVANFGHDDASDVSIALTDNNQITFDNNQIDFSSIPQGTSKTFEVTATTADAISMIDHQISASNFNCSEVLTLGVNSGIQTFELDDNSFFKDYKVRSVYNNDWKISSNEYHSSSKSFLYRNNDSYQPFADGALETPFFLLNGKSTFSFWGNYSTQENWDGGYLEIFHEGEWKAIQPEGGYPSFVCNELMEVYGKQGAFSGYGNGWKKEKMDVSQFEGLVKFRFRFLSEGANHNDGWAVDDIEYNYNAIPQGVNDHEGFVEAQTFPNPFQHSTTVYYNLEETGQLELALYDLTGKKITDLENGHYGTGSFRSTINANELSLAEGTYLVKLRIQSNQSIRTYQSKITLIK